MSIDRFLEELIHLRGNRKIFIETGSGLGGGIALALKAGFETVYSVELNPVLYEKCQKRFENNSNVHLMLGSSELILPKILESMTEPFLLFLDAHYSGGDYIGEQMHDYLPKEMAAIVHLHSKLQGGVLMIDDINFYVNHPRFINLIEYLAYNIKREGTLSYLQKDSIVVDGEFHGGVKILVVT